MDLSARRITGTRDNGDTDAGYVGDDLNHKGFFQTANSTGTAATDLILAYPTGEEGWYAVVASTATIWTWNPTSMAWVDSGNAFTGTIDWGSITGTLSNQSDLQAELNAKEDTIGYTTEDVANKATDLLSPDDTKYPTTLAVSTSISAIDTSTVWGDIGGTVANQTDLQNALSLKENLANKATDFITINNTKYPTTEAVDTELANYLDKTTYDPTAVGGDSFDMDNMVEGTTNKIFTATERTKLTGIEAGADVTDSTNVNAVATQVVAIACSDETSDQSTGTAKCTFRMPFAMTLSEVRASLTTAATGADFIIDINEGGTSILSTKITIDATEKTSTTAATPPVISDSSLADDAEITVDFDQVGSTVTGAGIKIYLIGVKS